VDEIDTSGVLVHQGEGGAGNMAFSWNAQTLGQSLHEGRFAGAKWSRKGDNIPDLKHAADLSREAVHSAGAVHT
jgi:hypothetical protein